MRIKQKHRSDKGNSLLVSQLLAILRKSIKVFLRWSFLLLRKKFWDIPIYMNWIPQVFVLPFFKEDSFQSQEHWKVVKACGPSLFQHSGGWDNSANLFSNCFCILPYQGANHEFNGMISICIFILLWSPSAKKGEKEALHVWIKFKHL